MYRLDTAQQVIVEKASALAEQHIKPHAAGVDAEGRFPREAIDALGQAGFLGLTIPETLGGMGQGLRVTCAVLDQIAQRCASTGMVYLMHLCGIACYTENAAAHLRTAAQGRHLSTLAWSERGSRSHFWAPVSQAVAQNGHTAISAQKSWVTSAGHADGYVVSTRWAQAKGPTDSMLYLVLRTDKGFSISGPWNGLGMRGNASAPIALEGVRVSGDRALSDPGKGFEKMLGVVLPVFQLGNAAVSIGIAEAAVQATQQHLTSQRFEHLDSKLSDLPNLRARLAQMRIETDKARAHLSCTIDAIENPGPMTQLLVLEIKASAAETAQHVTDLGMRACGGAAFSRHLGLERNFRDARAAAVMAPTSDVASEFIGRALCGMEMF